MNITCGIEADKNITSFENEDTAQPRNLEFETNIDDTNINFDIVQENDSNTFLLCEASVSNHSEREFIEHFNINEEKNSTVSQDASCGTSCSIEHEKENIRNLGNKTKITEDIATQYTSCGAPIYKKKCRNIDSFNLHELLQKSCIGRSIIKDYERNSILCKKSRNSLVSIIINNFLDEST